MRVQMLPTHGMPVWPIVGHGWAVRFLARAVATGQVRHAYLFTGPEQVGKTTLARAFAQALNCQANVESRPCGVCDACQRIARGVHPDVRLITPQGRISQASAPFAHRIEATPRGTGEILIEQVRGLIHEAALSPMSGRYKVFLVREADRASAPAMNAFLKTLEEPPPFVVLLLTSSHPERLLPTIISRCQVLPLRSVAVQQIETMLRERGVEAERAALLARLADGRPGWAITAATDASIWQLRATWLGDLDRLLAQGRAERLLYAERLAAHPEAVASLLTLWASWWRDLLLWQQSCEQAIVHIDRREALRAQAERLPPAQVRGFVERLAAAKEHLEQNVNTRLLLESLLLHLPRLTERQPA